MNLLDQIEIDIGTPENLLTVYVDIWDLSLSRKWLASLNHLIKNNYHLEKNYCFFGFPDSVRNGNYICDQINQSIVAINSAGLGYVIDDNFTLENAVDGDCKDVKPHWVNREKFNNLHRYFEDLQGTNGAMSPYYVKADYNTRWHIRQLNLLCHEFESWALSWKKKHTAPEWIRPSQLMCWLNAPRFVLDEEDYEIFGIDSINRSMGGVFVGVNKAIGKHHWEVFCDEGIDLEELTTTTLRPQTLAAGDFDIEWANDPGRFPWQIQRLNEFKEWLIKNKFDPDDKSLTIGHPQVGQVDLIRSFASEDYKKIWPQLETRLNVHAIRTSSAATEYNYNWTDPGYYQQQINVLKSL
jgi:hypothetical protein